MKKMIPALAMAALALVGCTTADTSAGPIQPLETSPMDVTEVAPTSPAPTEASMGTAESSDSWADVQLKKFIDTAGANSLDAWPEGSAERSIVSVGSPDPGVFLDTVANLSFSDIELDDLASDYMYRVGCADEEVKMVIVDTADKSNSITRSSCT